MAREVWAAASYLYFSQGSFSMRGIQALIGLPTQNAVLRAFKVLHEYGYIKRGPVGASRTATILIPLLEMKEEDDS